MKRTVITALALCALVIFTGCGNSPKKAENNSAKPATTTTEQVKPASNTGQKALGAITPEQGLEYMQKTKDLVIVDVAPLKHYNKEHFVGAISIPIENITKEEETKRYKELPKGKPVLVHCRKGIYAPPAYKRLLEVRPDIPEVSYIAGAPLFKRYNEWFNLQPH
jgi:rhodanese-related sulfurtransferase